jgi:manganese peroxidase
MRSAAILALVVGAFAFPGMKDAMDEIQRRQGTDSKEIIGDLVELPDSKLTPTGKAIKSLLLGDDNPEDVTSTYVAPPTDSEACKNDPCCIWKYIAEEMRKAMVGTAGRCNNLARGSVRLGFHDAGTWSKNTGRGGGADGSIVLAGECYDRSENSGLVETCDQYKTWFGKYKSYGISMADLIQMGANVATVVCPLGPRVRSFVGRKDNNAAAPTGLLPTPFDSAEKLINLFADKTISPAGLVALVGAHTTSQQRFVDPARAGDPQDSTPGVWDVAFYGQTTDPNAPKRVFKFQSDINLSKDPRTAPTWNAFSGLITGQLPWNQVSSRQPNQLFTQQGPWLT